VILAESWMAAAARLRERNVEDSELETEVLLRHVLGWCRARFFASLRDHISSADLLDAVDLVERRAHGEPLPYIVGHREFYGLDLHVDRRVLIPRQETELLVDEVRSYAERQQRGVEEGGDPLTICDVGTGSGAIAVALATCLPYATVYATDSNPDALRVAEINARRQDVSDRINLVECDLLGGLPSPVDVIVSNPPYVKSSVLPTLQREIGWEPKESLDGGPDGLGVIRRMFNRAPDYLLEGGFMIVEIDPGQRHAAMDIVEGAFGKVCAEPLMDLSAMTRAIRLELSVIDDHQQGRLEV